ncbi:MAG: protein-L-isoaspartate(D-aspartate) O-methyltransferase, partial [Porticoccaceae bacterium]
SGIGMTSQRTRERLIQSLQEQGIENQKVLDAMRLVPRHIFLDEALAHRAYENTALPIGYSQTISQPYIVALMTQLVLAWGPRQKVLEIGTGSGYQAAILSHLVDKVYTVERIKPLLMKARERFRLLGLRNIISGHSDGGEGWGQYAPYDAIISTAAPQQVPEELLHQLAPNGILVIPVGPDNNQELRVIHRMGETSNFEEEVITRVRFVPLLGGTQR